MRCCYVTACINGWGHDDPLDSGSFFFLCRVIIIQHLQNVSEGSFLLLCVVHFKASPACDFHSAPSAGCTYGVVADCILIVWLSGLFVCLFSLLLCCCFFLLGLKADHKAAVPKLPCMCLESRLAKVQEN